MKSRGTQVVVALAAALRQAVLELRDQLLEAHRGGFEAQLVLHIAIVTL